MEISLWEDRHCEKAFPADEAIFAASITSRIDCFVVPLLAMTTFLGILSMVGIIYLVKINMIDRSI